MEPPNENPVPNPGVTVVDPNPKVGAEVAAAPRLGAADVSPPKLNPPVV